MWRGIAPLIMFLLLVLALAIGLTRDPSEVSSPLIGKPAPEFSLPRLHQPDKSIALNDLKGEVSLINVWASWCGSCRVEHPFLIEIAKSGVIPIYGLNYKDEPEDAINWLSKLGDPYKAVAVDYKGRVGIDFGVYGAPESYLLDQNGVIIYKKIGPVTPDDWRKNILPLINKLRTNRS